MPLSEPRLLCLKKKLRCAHLQTTNQAVVNIASQTASEDVYLNIVPKEDMALELLSRPTAIFSPTTMSSTAPAPCASVFMMAPTIPLNWLAMIQQMI